jgi:predicted RNA polymerase sigma factor
VPLDEQRRGLAPSPSPWSTAPRAGLAQLGTLDDGPGTDVARTHRLDAVRGHLLELAGEPAAAREAYLRAARRTTSLPERRYLDLRAARLNDAPR